MSCTLKRISRKQRSNVDWIVVATNRSWYIHFCIPTEIANIYANFYYTISIYYPPRWSLITRKPHQIMRRWIHKQISFNFAARVPIALKQKLELPVHRLARSRSVFFGSLHTAMTNWNFSQHKRDAKWNGRRECCWLVLAHDRKSRRDRETPPWDISFVLLTMS